MARRPRGRAPPRHAHGPAPPRHAHDPAAGHPLTSLRATDGVVYAHPHRRHFRVRVLAADSVHAAWEMRRLLAAQKSDYDWYVTNFAPLEAAADLRFPVDDARAAFASLLQRISGVNTTIEVTHGGGRGRGVPHAHAPCLGVGRGCRVVGGGRGLGALVRGGHAVQGGPERDGYRLAYSFMLYPGDTGTIDPHGVLVTVEETEQALEHTTCTALRGRAAGLAGKMRGARRTVEFFDEEMRLARKSSHSRLCTLQEMQAWVASVRAHQKIAVRSLRHILRQIDGFAQRSISF